MRPDRLQARIRHQLSLPSPDLEARALAVELAETGRRARERLEQCATLVRVGNEQAALQAAEAEPSLLELCAWISFDGSVEWARLCEKHGLPVTPAPDDAQVLTVELLYGKPIDENHPLYRDYRQAIRERDEARALTVLRSITSVNPGDANAQSELKRLRAKFMRSALDKVTAQLAQGDDAGAVQLMERMEQLGAATLLGDASWDAALRRRAAWIQTQSKLRLAGHCTRARAARESNDWRTCADEIGAVRTIERNTGLSADDAEALALLEQWAGEHVATAAAEHQARAAAEKLRMEWTQLSAEAEQRISADLLRRLNQWIELAKATTVGLPDEQLAAAQRLSRAIHQRVVRQHTLRVTIGLAVVLVMVAIAYFAQQSLAARSALDDVLASAEQPAESWDFEAVEHVLAKATILATNDELRVELAKRTEDLRRRMQPLKLREQALAAEAAFLASARNSGPKPENFAEIKRRALALEEALEEIGPSAAVRLRGKSGDLPELVARCNVVASGLQAQVEGLVNELELAVGTNEQLADSAQAEAILARIRVLLTSPGATLVVGEATHDRALALAERVEQRLTLERMRQSTLRRLSGASDLATYLKEIQVMADATADTPERAAARHVREHAESLLQSPRSLLSPRAGAMWDAAETPFSPVLSPNAEESRIVAQLCDHEILRNLRKYIIRKHTSPEPGMSQASPSGFEYISGGLTTESRQLQGGRETVYSGKVLRSSGDLVEQKWSLRTFNNGVISGLEPSEGLPLPEVDYLRRFARFFNTSGNSLAESPLRTIERVRRETGTQILRAYHLQELFRLAAVRPSESGFAFSPSAQRDADELRGITQNRLTAVEFLFDNDPALKAQLTKFHATNTVNYTDESQFLRKLFESLRRGTISLVGQVSTDGKPVWKIAPTPGALLIGIDTEGQPAVLFECASDGSIKAVGSPAALSPLLRLTVSPAEAAEAAGKRPASLSVPSGDWNNLVKGRDL